jgi:hypothetical protein
VFIVIGVIELEHWKRESAPHQANNWVTEGENQTRVSRKQREKVMVVSERIRKPHWKQESRADLIK